MPIKITILIVTIILLWGIVDLQHGNTFFIGTYLFSFLVFLITLPITLILLVIPKLRLYAKFFGLISIGFLVEIVSVHFIAEYQAKKSREVGDRIVFSIQQAFKDNGKYYNSLNSYIPQYIEVIPRTKLGFFGTEYIYWKTNSDFSLLFEARYGDIHKYQSEHGWILTD